MILHEAAPDVHHLHLHVRPIRPGDAVSTFSPQGKFTESIADAVEAAKESKEMKVEYMTFHGIAPP